MYGSCNESESEEDNVYRQNVASDDRKKELKSPKASLTSLDEEHQHQLNRQRQQFTIELVK
jgi:hypothetical protein